MARAVMRVMRVEFHSGAAIKGVQSPEKTLQRIRLEKRVVLGYAGNVYRKLVIWNTIRAIINQFLNFYNGCVQSLLELGYILSRFYSYFHKQEINLDKIR